MKEDHRWKEDDLVVLDLETTGLSPEKSRIIEVAMIRVRALRAEGTLSLLLDPGVDLPDRITEVTGIRTEDVRGQPTFRERVFEILDFVGDSPLMIFNVPFDAPLLAAEVRRCSVRVPRNVRVGAALDPMVWVRDIDKYVKGKRRHSLEVSARRWGVPPDGEAHRALVDCGMTLGLSGKLRGRIGDRTAAVLRWQERRRIAQLEERREYRALMKERHERELRYARGKGGEK